MSSLPDARVHGDVVEHRGRRTRIGAFPIGIIPEGFQEPAEPATPDPDPTQTPPADQLRLTHTYACVTLRSSDDQGTVLETTDLDAEVAALRDRGVPMDGEIEEAPWGRWATFSDPDGNGFVLQASAQESR